MVKNHDAGDVKGLEEVFRSQEISRTSGGSGSEPGRPPWRTVTSRCYGGCSATRRARCATSIVPTTRVPTGAPRARRAGAGARRGSCRSATPRRPRRVAVELGSGRHVAAVPPWKRQSSRYRTIAAFSAVVALVVAGVTAGTAQHGPSNRSAQGAHGTARPARPHCAARHWLDRADGAGLPDRRRRIRRPGPGDAFGGRTRFGQRTGWARHAHWSGIDDRHAARRRAVGRPGGGSRAADPLVRRRVRAAAIRCRRSRPGSGTRSPRSGLRSRASRTNSGAPFPRQHRRRARRPAR